MNKDRKQLFQKQIDEMFTAIINLQSAITDKDFKWAEKNWEFDQTASEIVGLGQNLIDWGKQFR